MVVRLSHNSIKIKKERVGSSDIPNMVVRLSHNSIKIKREGAGSSDM